MKKKLTLDRCPFCTRTPDINDPETFEHCPATNWGAVVCDCGCSGPAVHTDGRSPEVWQLVAAHAWNARPVPVHPPLFKYGAFTSHNGVHLPDKIDCDALTKADWDTLAAWVARHIGFGKVIGIETGGIKFAEALQQHCSPFGPVLIVDDVLTTGKSMEEMRAQYPGAVGAVVFARGKLPDWVIARFSE